MIIQNLSSQKPFTTKDGSQIRSILDKRNSAVKNQSLAEAFLVVGQKTERHFHQVSEELYFILEGAGELEINGEVCKVSAGDCALIPPGAWHEIRALEPLRFLCCCAPPYSDADTFFE